MCYGRKLGLMTVFRHRAVGTFGNGELWTFGIYSEGSGTVDAAESSWDDGVTAFFSTALAARIASSVTTLTTSTASIDETTGHQITRRELVNTSGGTSTAESLPYQVTPVVGLRTQLATRAGRGRFYAPSLAVDQIAGGRMLPAARSDLADAAAAMLGELMTGGLVPVIFHRTQSPSAGLFTTTQITSIDVGDVLDTQRRRRNKLVEERETRVL